MNGNKCHHCPEVRILMARVWFDSSLKVDCSLPRADLDIDLDLPGPDPCLLEGVMAALGPTRSGTGCLSAGPSSAAVRVLGADAHCGQMMGGAMWAPSMRGPFPILLARRGGRGIHVCGGLRKVGGRGRGLLGAPSLPFPGSAW